jgi:hypothetical protein
MGTVGVLKRVNVTIRSLSATESKIAKQTRKYGGVNVDAAEPDESDDLQA